MSMSMCRTCRCMLCVLLSHYDTWCIDTPPSLHTFPLPSFCILILLRTHTHLLLLLPLPGYFWMSYKSFLLHFSCTYFVKLFPSAKFGFYCARGIHLSGGDVCYTASCCLPSTLIVTNMHATSLLSMSSPPNYSPLDPVLSPLFLHSNPLSPLPPLPPLIGIIITLSSAIYPLPPHSATCRRVEEENSRGSCTHPPGQSHSSAGCYKQQEQRYQECEPHNAHHTRLQHTLSQNQTVPSQILTFVVSFSSFPSLPFLSSTGHCSSGDRWRLVLVQ
jgi:hypothetical protein